MKNVLISWGFNTSTGKLYLDCYLEIMHDDQTADAKMIDLRSRTQGTHLAILQVPKDMTRKELEAYISLDTTEVRNTLLNAKVTINKIIKRGYESNSLNFIMGV